jgi:hypothetical protein
VTTFVPLRHCEARRAAATQGVVAQTLGLLRSARNDEVVFEMRSSLARRCFDKRGMSGMVMNEIAAARRTHNERNS